MRLSFAVKSCIKYFSITAFVFGFIIATSAQLKAQIVLDSGSFNRGTDVDAPATVNYTVATAEFELTSTDDIPNVSFLANFVAVDAGVAIVVNNIPLFSTGDDVSQFGPRVFQTTLGFSFPGDQEDGNIQGPFGVIDDPTGVPLTRLTVQADSTGTSFSGVAVVDPGSVESFTPDLSGNNGSDFSNLSDPLSFSNLLQVGDNTIEIVNLNSTDAANLVGDFTVTLPDTTSVPEPNSLLGLLTLAGMLSLRRRRA